MSTNLPYKRLKPTGLPQPNVVRRPPQPNAAGYSPYSKATRFKPAALVVTTLVAVIGMLAGVLGLATSLATTASAQNVLAPTIHNNETDARILQLAQSGSSANQILSEIYPDSSVTNSGTAWLRVFLADSTSTTFTPEGLNRVTIDDETLFRATPGTPIRITLENDRWLITGPDDVCPAGGCVGDTVRVLFATATSVRVAATGKSYFHGRFTLTKNSNGSYKIVLDSIRLDDYLKGLNVSNWDWPAEALRARAIEARSYILSQHNSRTANQLWTQPFDIYSAAPDLPYLGDDIELNPSANGWIQAINATAGLVLSDGSSAPAPPTANPPASNPTPSTDTPAATPAPAPAPAPTPAPTPPNNAPASFTFSGRGWGHGVGMSQYGAFGRAAAGHSYQQILNFYYPNTSLGTQSAPVTDLRVFLTSAQSTTFTPQGNGQVYLDGQPLSAVSPGTGVAVRLTGNAWHISIGGASLCPAQGCAGQRVNVAFASNSSIGVAATGRSYAHGRITLSKKSGAEFYIVLDSISMEDYLLGIAEMPSDWHIEALKVQAVAARSYAYAVLFDRRQNPSWILPFDIYANTQDQFYAGDTREKSPYAGGWIQAVASTANQVLLYNGGYVVAHYSSSNGGYMSEDTFRSVANRKPYLQAAPDSYDNYTNPYSTWQVTFSNASLSSWLNTYNDTYVGTLQSITIANNRSPSGRINSASVTLAGSAGVKTVSGSRFYAVVNAGSIRHFNGYSRTLRSTLLAVGNSYPTLPTGNPSQPPQTSPRPTPSPSPTPSPQPSPPASNPQPYIPPERLQPDTYDLTGSLDSLMYQDGVLYATGTAIAIPSDNLSIEFLIDETTVKRGTLNRQMTIQTSATRSATGAFGFSNALNVPMGSHSVCLFVDDGENRLLADCRLIGALPQKPSAAFESLTASADGTATLTGWAYDIDNIFEPVEIRVLTRKLPSNTSSYLPNTLANLERAEFKNSVNELAAERAWEVKVSGLTAGNHEFCAWASDTNYATTRSTFLGCKTVRVG